MESFSPRMYMWSRVPAVVEEHPLIGVGMFEGGLEVSRMEPEAGRKIFIAIDNIFFTTLVEEGLVGTLLVCSTLALVFLQARRLLRRNGTMAGWAAVLSFSVIAVIVEGMSFDSMLFWANMVIFWLVIGLLRAISEVDRRGSSEVVNL